jgi:hypothetical protein
MVMRIIPLLLILLLTGCATMNETRVGSKAWHEVRIAEIDSSYEFGEIDKEAYLELKGAADQTRMDYQTALQERQDRQVRSSYRSYPFGMHGFGHHHHHRRR